MAEPTISPSAHPQKPKPPAILSAEQLYDMLMGQIEPDLVSGEIARLKEKYPNETPEEKAKRAERYTKAFAEYEQRLKKYQEEWNMNLRNFKRLAVAYFEGKDKGGESAVLQNLESSLSA